MPGGPSPPWHRFAPLEIENRMCGDDRIEDRGTACIEELQAEMQLESEKKRTAPKKARRPIPRGFLGVMAAKKLQENPEWTDQQVADALGCERTSLYRCKEYKVFREMLRREKYSRPRGVVGLDARGLQSIEAWSADDDELVR